jgi:hypothetical protein
LYASSKSFLYRASSFSFFDLNPNIDVAVELRSWIRTRPNRSNRVFLTFKCYPMNVSIHPFADLAFSVWQSSRLENNECLNKRNLSPIYLKSTQRLSN